MEIESKKIDLSTNAEVFQHFYAIVAFDGGTYTAQFNCKLHEEALARKMQKNSTGAFGVKIGDNEITFNRYDHDMTVAWTNTETLAYKDPHKLKEDVEAIKLAVNKYATEKYEELVKDVEVFNSLFPEDSESRGILIEEEDE